MLGLKNQTEINFADIVLSIPKIESFKFHYDTVKPIFLFFN